MEFERIVDTLYCEAANEDLKKSIIETDEVTQEYNAFWDKVIKPVCDDNLEKGNDIDLELMCLLGTYERAAFRAGVITAINFLKGVALKAVSEE